MNGVVEKYTLAIIVGRLYLRKNSKQENNVLVVPRVIDVLDSTDVEPIVPVPTAPDVAEPEIKQLQEK